MNMWKQAFRNWRCKLGWHVGPMRITKPRLNADQVEVEHVPPGETPPPGSHKRCGWCGTMWALRGHGEAWEKIW